MKILVGISGASGVDLGFLLLKSLEIYAKKAEIYAIVSDGAKISFLAENSLGCRGDLSPKKSATSNDSNSWIASSNATHSPRNNGEFANFTKHKNGKVVDFASCYRTRNSFFRVAKKPLRLKRFEFANANSRNDGKNSKFKKNSSENSRLNSQIQSDIKSLSNSDFTAFCQEKFALKKTHFLDDNDLSAGPSSGSFGITQSIIAPCSINTLAKIKHGICDTLMTRAAAVALKERRQLILAVRESPFSTISLKQMFKLSQMGVIIAPPLYANYAHIEHLSDLKNFIIGKWLDSLEIPHDLYEKWRDF